MGEVSDQHEISCGFTKAVTDDTGIIIRRETGALAEPLAREQSLGQNLRRLARPPGAHE